MESIFKKQDLFLTQMRKDYTTGNIPRSDMFKPYFEWKKGGTLITSAITVMCRNILVGVRIHVIKMFQ